MITACQAIVLLIAVGAVAIVAYELWRHRDEIRDALRMEYVDETEDARMVRLIDEAERAYRGE